MVRLAFTKTDAGSSPAGTAQYGRASQLARWHPVGSRARRKPLQVRVLSLPLTRACSGAPGEAPTRTQRVRLFPPLLFVILLRLWPRGPGTGSPCRTGGFDS